MMSRFLVLFPLALALVAFVLSNLTLFAGRDKGFMEDYAVLRLNTSMLGHNLLDTDNNTASTSSDDGDESLWDKIEDKWDDVKDDVTEGINNITGAIADELAETLGIDEWYSLHVMSACRGYYKPNATSPDAGFNITNCTSTTPDKRFNLTKLLDHDLGVGPFQISLADLQWPEQIEDAVDLLNDGILAMFVILVLSVGFSGLSMLGCIVAFFLAGRRWVATVNLAIASLGALCLLICSILITVMAQKGAEKINKYGEDVGISADKGNKLIAIMWVAAAFMITVALYWVAQKVVARKQRKREWKGRKGSL